MASQEKAPILSGPSEGAAARDQPASVWGQLQKALRRFCGSVLKTGPVPEHVAIIMDGNRRFAKGRQLAQQEGHAFGYKKLEEALEWCLDLGIACVSVYAFSIENFRRSPAEVDTLMRLAEQKLGELMQVQPLGISPSLGGAGNDRVSAFNVEMELMDTQGPLGQPLSLSAAESILQHHAVQESSLIQKYGVRVQVLGELSLLPAAVQQAAHRITAATAHYTTCTLNICFSYTSSQEMARAVQQTRHDLQHQPGASDTEVGYLLESHLDTQGLPPVGLLIRTSGEQRLSNFLLWQSAFAHLVFLDVLWPDFSFWSFLCALLDYQRHAAHLSEMMGQTAASRSTITS